MRKTALLLAVALGGLALALPAKAADFVEAPSVYDWTGFYIGPHVGYGWSTKDWSFTDTDGQDSVTDDFSYDMKGWLVGGQAGADYQMGWLVIGVEGDFSWTWIDGDGNREDEQNIDSSIDWIAMLTPRVGVALDRVLIYGKGGVAWVREEHEFTETHKYSSESQSDRGTESGWTLGAGVEYAVDDNWSVKAEYNYINLGKSNADFTDIEDDDAELKQHIHLVKAGVNFRF